MQNAAKCSTSKSIQRAVSHRWLFRLPNCPRYQATAAFISATLLSADTRLRRLTLCAFVWLYIQAFQYLIIYVILHLKFVFLFEIAGCRIQNVGNPCLLFQIRTFIQKITICIRPISTISDPPLIFIFVNVCSPRKATMTTSKILFICCFKYLECITKFLTQLLCQAICTQRTPEGTK